MRNARTLSLSHGPVFGLSLLAMFMLGMALDMLYPVRTPATRVQYLLEHP